MALRGTGAGPLESGAENNADLNSLGSAVNDAFKDLEANPDAGGNIEVPKGDLEDEPPPPDDEADEDADKDEDVDADDEKRAEEKKEAAPPAAPPAAPGTEPGSKPGEPPSAPTVPAKLKDLSGYAKDHLDGVRKFVPGNTLEGVTEEAFATAQEKMVADYWRIQKENARLAKEKEAPSDTPKDPSPSQPAPPKEVEYLHARMQEIVQTDGPKAQAQIEGWRAQAQKLREGLAAKEASGEADSDDLLQAHRAINAAERNAELWTKTYNKHGKEFRDLKTRETEVRLTLETRDRLDRREKKDADQQQEHLSNTFLSDWNKTYDEILTADEYKVLDVEDRASLRKHAMAQTHFEAGAREGGIATKDVKGFLTKVITDFTAPIKKAEERARKAIATDKATDAPKIPPQASSPRKPRDKRSSSAAPSLRTLEQQVMKNDAWDKV